MEQRASYPTLDIADYVFAVVVAAHSDATVRAVCGTGFMLPGGIFVTCWHCVNGSISSDESFVAARRMRDGTYQALLLSMLAQDQNGADLALARLPDSYRPPDLLELASADSIMSGMDVGTYGCSLPERNISASGFVTHFRTLRGYITRSFVYDRPGWGPTPSFELDMPDSRRSERRAVAAREANEGHRRCLRHARCLLDRRGSLS